MSAGNLNSDAGKKNNFSYQFNVLRSLGLIGSNTDGLESLLTQLLASFQASQDYESQFVTDADGVSWLEVRIYNQDTQTFDAPIYYAPGSNVAGAPALPIAYVVPAATPVTALLIPEVATVPVTNWDASVDFTSDIISFVGRSKSTPWAFQITDYAITPGLPTLTLEVSLNGVDFTNYKTASTLIDMTDTVNNAFSFDDITAFEYARFVYVSGGSTGSFSLIVSK